MAELIALLVALFLLFVAASLAATLRRYRRQRLAARAAARARGRFVVAEIPVETGLLLFSEDDGHFYYGERPIDKERIQAVRVLINGSPIAAYVSPRFPEAESARPTEFDDPPDGIARDRWDVAIESAEGTTLVECGSLRERVSQELGRKIYEVVKRSVERRDEGRGSS